jgi:energy-coupling factor transporter ATP-binding protein EcfA2
MAQWINPALATLSGSALTSIKRLVHHLDTTSLITMGYLNDYVYYGSGTECPDIYLQWSGLSLLGAVLGRKTWTMHGGYFRIHPKLYVCLVGDAGSGKSTAKNQAKQFLRVIDPNYLISASFQSHQDIIDKMATDAAAVKTWKDATNGKIHEYRVFYGICNELASLLSTDKKGMVEFLVDVFDDEDEFTTGYKGQRLESPERKQVVPFPYVSILACAVPKWFMGNLKLDLFDGGLGRRLIVCYSNKTRLNENPHTPPGGEQAKQRALQHLAECMSEKCQGELKKTPAAQLWWKEWYHNPKRFDLTDPILGQFHQTKHIQALKVASLLAKSEDPFNDKIEDVHLQAAVAMMDMLEPNVLKLTGGIGRNELAGVGQQIIDFLERTGGMQTEVNLKKYFHRYLKLPEFQELENHYVQTGQIIIAVAEIEGVMRKFYFTPQGFEEYNRMKKAAGR